MPFSSQFSSRAINEIAEVLGWSKADIYRVATTLGCQSNRASTTVIALPDTGRHDLYSAVTARPLD